MANIKSCKVIGADEAGRGPVLGPMVVAAIATKSQAELKKLGVKDSKALTPSRRKELAGKIYRTCEVACQIVGAAEIDSQRRNMTLNRIEIIAFAQVINSLLDNPYENSDFTGIIVDAADVNAGRFGENIRALLVRGGRTLPKIISRHKADDLYPAVSAASIVAKVTRDEEMAILREEYGNLGSGYPSDPVTRKYLLELFRSGEPVPDFVRTSWETIKKIKDAACTRSLDDFFQRREQQ